MEQMSKEIQLSAQICVSFIFIICFCIYFGTSSVTASKHLISCFVKYRTKKPQLSSKSNSILHDELKNQRILKIKFDFKLIKSQLKIYEKSFK